MGSEFITGQRQLYRSKRLSNPCCPEIPCHLAMIRVGIVSLPLTYNIGGILQSFALVEICKTKGWRPFVLTRRRSRRFCALKLLVSAKWKCVYLLSAIATKLKFSFLLSYPLIATQSFKNRYIPCSNVIFFDDDLLSRWSFRQEIDMFICGSDQIWNPSSFPSLRFAFAQFDISRRTKRVAFAPSLGHGLNRFSSFQSKQISNYLQSFTKISCREESGVDLISSLTTHPVILMPDPTFVVNKEVYKTFASNADYPFPHRYLFAYILDPSITILKSIARIAKANNLVPISFFPLYYKAIICRHSSLLQRLGIKVVTSPSPENWLGGIDSASLVITDSFHGSVFSLILNTPFYSLINENRGPARFMQLKQTFDIADIFLKPKDLYSQPQEIPSINWERVNYTIAGLAKSAHSFFEDLITNS